MKAFKSRGAAFALVVLLGLASVLAGFWAMRATAPPGQQAQQMTPMQQVARIFVPDPAQVFGRDHLRVLVVGLDYDYDPSDQETSAHSRSDIIMAVNLDFLNHRIYELSVPRDMVATLPDGTQAKINQAQSDGGIAESQSVVSQWLGIPNFDRYVVLRIDTMKDLINALGGVNVDVKNSDALQGTGPNGPIDYDDSWGHLHVHLRPGLQHLDGDQAVGYARFRHDWCSDPCRIMRQQQVIHAIAQQIQQHRLNTLLHIRSLLAVVNKDIQTNLTHGEELSLAFAFAHVAPKDVVTAQVPYVADVDLPTYGDSIVPDQERKRALVAAMLGEPAPPDPDPALLATLSPATIRVQVRNGSGVPGLAARVARKLGAAGFVVASVGDADESDVQESTISGGSPSAPLAFKVRQALGPAAKDARVAYTATDAGTPDNTVLVVVGADVAKTYEAK
ncbi:MAG TPA: LCP family protein [Candidatus Acidoferrales bacterium]|nr:LCP family protein [Candidatus Acidoferrales bacterium]